jgi:hypothetical protein
MLRVPSRECRNRDMVSCHKPSMWVNFGLAQPVSHLLQQLIPKIKNSKFQLHKGENNGGQGDTLDKSSVLTILSILLLSFLSLIVISVTRLLTWDTPDSPIPKWAPICFSFCLYIFEKETFLHFCPKQMLFRKRFRLHRIYLKSSFAYSSISTRIAL